MPIKPHPTDPDKMVYVKREYNLPKEWVGLTDDEKHSAIWTGGEFGDGVLWAEKLLKERNT